MKGSQGENVPNAVMLTKIVAIAAHRILKTIGCARPVARFGHFVPHVGNNCKATRVPAVGRKSQLPVQNVNQ